MSVFSDQHKPSRESGFLLISEEQRRANKHRLVLALEQLQEIAIAFAGMSVHWVLVKGVGLSLGVYPDPFQRPFSDLDIFVAPEHFGAAVLALADLDYRPLGAPDASLVHWTFTRKNAFPVELHFCFSREFPTPFEHVRRLVKARQIIGNCGFDLPVPDLAHHFAYVLLHAYNHGWQLAPFWISDLMHLLQADPHLVDDALKFFGPQTPVALSLQVAGCLEPGLRAWIPPGLPGRAIAEVMVRSRTFVRMIPVLPVVLRMVASPQPTRTLLRMLSRHRLRGVS